MGLGIQQTPHSAAFNVFVNNTTNYSRTKTSDLVANSGFLDQVVFNTDLADPDLLAGQLQWNSTEGTLDLGLNDNYAMHLGEEMLYRVRNTTGSTLRAGQPVYASGLSPGGNNRIEVNLYTANGTTREIRFMGLMTSDLTDNGNNGYATHFGYIRGVNTNGGVATDYSDKLWVSGEPDWNEGDILYVHPTVPGKLTKTEPKHSISVAIITSKANNGKLFVRPTSYGHLDDNHDVNLTGASNGQFLQYNSSTDYWIPSSSGNFTTLTINGNQIPVGTGISNHVAYWNSSSGLIADNGQLYWDPTNNRLGIGTSSPSTTLDVSGIINATGGNSTNWNTSYGWGNHASQGYLTSLAHNHGVANSAGTQQFTFGVNENIRFSGGGSTSVSFNSDTKLITISSTDTNTTYSAISGVALSGTTFYHINTSSQASVNNSNGNVIQDVTLDDYGHITGLGTVDLDSRYYTESETDNLLSNKLNTSLKGSNNGLAELDSTGKVPSSQLPSYVDDVLEYATTGDFPVTGETGKIYVATSTNLTYRWSGSAYVEISASLALGETSSTAYRGDRGKTAYDHSQQNTGSVHGSTTVGGNLLRLSDPSAIRFLRVNADNTVSTLSDSDFRTAIGVGVGVGTVTNVSALTIGTIGSDISSSVSDPTTTPVITLNIPTASATSRGVLSSGDWTTFNNKQAALTNPVTGTGTTNYISKWINTSIQGNSIIFDDGTKVGIGTTSPSYQLDVIGTGNFSENLLVNGTGVSLNGHTHKTSNILIGDTGESLESLDPFFSGVALGGSINDGIVAGGGISSYVINDFSSSVSGLLPVIENSGNNRILTSTGTTTGINAESNATFDGTTLAISGEIIVDNLKLDGNTISSTSGNLIIQPSGSGALQSDSSGDVRGQYAVDLQRVRDSNASVASGHYSVIGGGRLNAASGEYSTVSGGSSNRASEGCTVGGGASNQAIGSGCTVGGGTGNSTDGSSSTVCGGSSNEATAALSTVCGGSSNEATAALSTVCGGYYNKASNYGCSVGGGNSNNATGQLSTVAGGAGNTASGEYSSVGGGGLNIASGYGSTVVGGIRGKATRYGEISHAAGNFVNAGDAQHTVLIARRLTTDNTANQVLFLDGSSYTNYKLTIPPKTTWTFEIKLSAYNNNDDTVAGWIYRGVIRRNGTDSTVMVGSLIEESWKEEPMDNTSANVIANDTNDTLEIRVTGLTGKNIRWVAVVDISQVSFGVP